MKDHSTDIFSDTIAEMTWMEVAQAARDDAVLLWAFGVIEQHGPHLPAGTDVYIPQAQLREVKRILARRGIQALIVPPYYWGVNVVSAAFPASYRVRPELMKEIMADLFDSFKTDGFKHVFCLSGHGDKLHNQTIYQGIKLGIERSGMDASFIADAALLMRLGISADDPCITLRAAGKAFFRTMARSADERESQDDGQQKYIDVHAGQWETSMMMCSCAALVHEDARRALPSTDYGPQDLDEWRNGHERAREKTPLGYFGDPAAASIEEGRHSLRQHAERIADAIERRLEARARDQL